MLVEKQLSFQLAGNLLDDQRADAPPRSVGEGKSTAIVDLWRSPGPSELDQCRHRQTIQHKLEFIRVQLLLERLYTI